MLLLVSCVLKPSFISIVHAFIALDLILEHIHLPAQSLDLIVKPLLLLGLVLKLIFELLVLLVAIGQVAMIFLVPGYRTFQFSLEFIDEVILFLQFAAECLFHILRVLVVLALQI